MLCVAVYSLCSHFPLNLSVSVVFVAVAIAVTVMLSSSLAHIQLYTIFAIDIATLCILSILYHILIHQSVVSRLSTIHLFTHLYMKFNLDFS